MFTSKLKNIIVAGTLAIGTLAAAFATTTTANAAGRGGLTISGPGIHFSIGHNRWDRGPRFDRRWVRPRHARCHPTRALHKAKRRGLRRAHIARVNRRGIIVTGRKWGERVVIGFGRHRSCPVRFVRAR